VPVHMRVGPSRYWFMYLCGLVSFLTSFKGNVSSKDTVLGLLRHRWRGHRKVTASTANQTEALLLLSEENVAAAFSDFCTIRRFQRLSQRLLYAVCVVAWKKDLMSYLHICKLQTCIHEISRPALEFSNALCIF